MSLADAKSVGSLTHLSGTGGPDHYRVLNITGWQKEFSASDRENGNPGMLAALQRPNPVLVLGLGPACDEQALREAAKQFGEARPPASRPPLRLLTPRRQVADVTQPKGASFAFVRYKEDKAAAKACEGLRSVGGASVAAQPAKQANAEVDAWRAALHASQKP
jgi:hypothetical protein